MHDARAWTLSVLFLVVIGWALWVWLWVPDRGGGLDLVPSLLAHRVASVVLAAGLVIALYFETSPERTR